MCALVLVLLFYVCLSFLYTVVILEYFRNGQSSLRLIFLNCTFDKYNMKGKEGGGREREGGSE